MALKMIDIPIKRRNLTLPPKPKIASTQEAMAILSQKYWKEIAAGRAVAKQIALANGTVTAREMVQAMIAQGLIVGSHHEHWVSVVFRDRKTWEWTGQVAAGTTTKTQGGVRWSKVWKLRVT